MRGDVASQQMRGARSRCVPFAAVVMASTYGLRATRGPRFNWSSHTLGLGGAVRGEEDLSDLYASPPTPEEVAAAGVGLDAAYPSRAERRAFPELLSKRAGAVEYLGVR